MGDGSPRAIGRHDGKGQSQAQGKTQPVGKGERRSLAVGLVYLDALAP